MNLSIVDFPLNESIETFEYSFSLLDKDKDGKISARDLELALNELGSNNLSQEELSSLIKEVSLTNDGFIHMADFAEHLKLKLREQGYLRNNIRNAFLEFDDLETGHISIEHVKSILENLDDSNSSHIDSILRQCSRDERGFVNYEELIDLLLSPL